MSRKTEALGKLQRLAQLRSDLEMRRFSAFRAHVTAARARVSALEENLQAIYQSPTAFSVPEARLANALAGECSRALLRAEADLQQMLPAFDAARQAATREFGRAEVLKSLQQETLDEERQLAAKKSNSTALGSGV